MLMLPYHLTPEYGYGTFDRLAAGQLVRRNWHHFAFIAVVYCTIVLKLIEFKIQTNNRFDAMHFIWNVMLLAYSIWTTWMMWDAWVRLVEESPDMSIIEYVRSPLYNDLTSYTRYVFIFSKITEFGGTIMILARGRVLKLIRWQHHLLAYGYACFEISSQYSRNSAMGFFVSADACVHVIIYGWLVISASGIRTPARLKQLVSSMQAFQQYFVCWLICTAYNANVWCANGLLVHSWLLGCVCVWCMCVLHIFCPGMRRLEANIAIDKHY